MSDLYGIMKGKAYGLACICTGRDNASAKTEGYRDVYDLLMSDSDNDRQPTFLTMLSNTIEAEGHRRILLDGLAKEYAGLGGWMEYVDRETK